MITILRGYRFLPVAWASIEELREQFGFIDKTTAFMFALLVSLLFAQLATLADLHMIIDGFIFGLFLRQSDVEPSLHEHMHPVIDDLAMGFFAPVFFVTVGFDIAFDVFFESVRILVARVAVASSAKSSGRSCLLSRRR